MNSMSKLISSASKVVFILMAITASIGFFLGMLSAELFMVLASATFAFYFSNKGSANGEPYLGK